MNNEETKNLGGRPTKLTNKQRKFLDILSDNLGNKEGGKSLKKMLLEAGYSENSAHQQTTILETEGIQKGMNPIIKKLEDAREEAYKRLDKTIDKADYKDLINSIDKLTKNIQLLSGGNTSKVELGFSELTDEELNEIIQNRSEEGTSEEGIS